jgi:hypothetical protein
MSDFVQQKVISWSDRKSRETYLSLQYLEKKLFSTYECTFPPNPSFWSRLTQWIKNANGNEHLEKQLFNSINNIFYIGPDEFSELYRQAYNGPIARWLIDINGINFQDINAAKTQLLCEVEKTWFCPISDSLKIGNFYHLNNIPSPADIRPDWRTLQQLGDEQKVRDHIKDNQIKNIVLLEDFVGGGSQMSDAVNYVSKFTDIVSVLIVPLVICPLGVSKIDIMLAGTKISIDPVLPLRAEEFIPALPVAGENSEISILRDLADTTYLTVSDGQLPGAVSGEGILLKPYFPLGWDNTGGLVVMCTNTPDNTLPMYHWDSATWNPIFPRHSRN